MVHLQYAEVFKGRRKGETLAALLTVKQGAGQEEQVC